MIIQLLDFEGLRRKLQLEQVLLLDLAGCLAALALAPSIRSVWHGADQGGFGWRFRLYEGFIVVNVAMHELVVVERGFCQMGSGAR